jgi:hypothetical protein
MHAKHARAIWREGNMSIELTRGNLSLKQHGIAVLKRSRGVRLAVMRGTVWLTIDGETRDVVLEACDVFAIESDVDIAISAIAGPIEVSVLTNTSAPTGGTNVAAALFRIWARVRRVLAGSGHVAAGVV